MTRLLLLFLALAGSPLREPIADARTFRLVPGLSEAQYAVDEVLFNENNRLFTAVGVTSGVEGEVLLDVEQPSRSQVLRITADLHKLTSDSDRRDLALRVKYLDTERYPLAVIDRATLLGLPARIHDGRAFTFSLRGNLTLHGATRITTWAGEATVTGDTLRGKARANVRMTDFGIEVPRLLSLRSSNEVALEVRFTAVAVPTPRERP